MKRRGISTTPCPREVGRSDADNCTAIRLPGADKGSGGLPVLSDRWSAEQLWPDCLDSEVKELAPIRCPTY